MFLKCPLPPALGHLMRCWLGWLGLGSQDFPPSAGLRPPAASTGTRRPIALEASQGRERQPVGAGVAQPARSRGPLGLHTAGAGDIPTQVQKARPSTGPTTEGPARDLPLLLAPTEATGPSCVPGTGCDPQGSAHKSQADGLVVHGPGPGFAICVRLGFSPSEGCSDSFSACLQGFYKGWMR